MSHPGSQPHSSDGATWVDDDSLEALVNERLGIVPQESSRTTRLLLYVSTACGILAAAKVSAALGLAARAGDVLALPQPASLFILLFGIGGAVLALGGSNRGGTQLGLLFVLIASAFADQLIPRDLIGVPGLIGGALRGLATEAFLALALWQFARQFPGPLSARAPARVADVFVAAAAAVGILLFAANEPRVGGFVVDRLPSTSTLFTVLDRRSPTYVFWPLLFGIAIPALPFLVWRSRFETVEVRQRAAAFVASLVIGFTPMLIAVAATPFTPALEDPDVRRVVGWILYGALLSIVPSSIYAVLVRRVIDVHVVIRKSLQYALMRGAVWVASLGPLVYLGLSAYVQRELTVGDFLDRRGSVGFLLMPLIGFAALTFRQQLLDGVDRWFLRGPIDHGEALARVEVKLRHAMSIRDIAVVLGDEIERAMHPTSLGIFVLNDAGDALVPLGGTIRPPRLGSMLLDLVRSSHTAIQLEPDADGPLVRALPAAERYWITAHRICLLSPLYGVNGAWLGVVAIGPSRSGLPYTKQDGVVLTMMGGRITLALENRWLSESPRADRQRAPVIDWTNEPAVQCQSCGLVWQGDTSRCSCGGETVQAALALVVNGKFRIERLIGRGGMGVVYLGLDLSLQRKVAIKTLPTMTPQRARRLKQEARTMASVLHPNLAMIFGVDEWRERPLLIVEYLEGGTLAQALQAEPLAIDEVIDLGIVLADSLDRVHASGVLHRDIKPSNIGYTRDGTPKLMDFGLASMLDGSSGQQALPAAVPSDDASGSGWPVATSTTTINNIVGTPLYLSPEAIEGATPQVSFDLWSLSLVLYEALSGRHPFAHHSVTEILHQIRRVRMPDVRDFRPDCPPPVAAVLNDALSLVAARRPATATELRSRLRRVRATIDTSA